ncbi:hypothetical protein CRUP_007752 [Coryphaenoides rupestris]|nr:hypothetical protein CRUP_007752 [Coryphaenoides rupestris]
MAFNFGGAAANPAASTTGFSFGSFGAKTTAPSAFGFGAAAATVPAVAAAAVAPGGFGTLTAPGFGAATTTAAAVPGFGFTPATTGAFGGFGASTTAAAVPGSTFSFAAPTNTTGGLFGNTQNKGFGFSTGLGAGTAGATGFGTTLGSGLGGFGGFNIQAAQPQQGGLFGQQQQAQQQQGQPQQVQLYQQVTALSAPTLLGDERDAILAKWNQLQAYWGTGKGYYNHSMPPVDFSLENPFCRFKAVGYSCIPGNKDEDGLVALCLNRREEEVRAQQQPLVESLFKLLGSNPMLSVNVEGVKALPDDQTEVIVYLVERSPNGTSKRITASALYSFVEQANVKAQLAQMGVLMSAWIRSYGSRPRLKIQEQMTKQHQTRVDIISGDISELQKNQATTVAKIAQYKRKLMDLSHRVLQVLIKQEIQRKSGYAIQVDEEHLRVQLDTIQSELNAPTQFKGRLNELMSQIRMQNHFGAVRSEERYNVDAVVLREIKQHLKQQQEGLSHLISVIKDDLEDIKLIEHGLMDSGHIRAGVHS